MTQKNITIEDVEHTAELARLELSDDEKKKFAVDLDNILGYFKDLEEADAEGVEKLNHYKLVSDIKNHIRADEVIKPPEGVREGIKNNFPASQGSLLEVKSVLKKK